MHRTDATSTEGQTDREKDRQTQQVQKDRQTERQHTDREKHRRTDRYRYTKNTHTKRQTDRIYNMHNTTCTEGTGFCAKRRRCTNLSKRLVNRAILWYH